MTMIQILKVFFNLFGKENKGFMNENMTIYLFVKYRKYEGRWLILLLDNLRQCS